MADADRRRKIIVAIIVLLIILILLLLLPKCLQKKPAAQTQQPSTTQQQAPATPSATVPATTAPTEVLTPATLTAPQQVTAGAAFAVTWTGPNNRGDFISIAQLDAPAAGYASYLETAKGATVELTAPIEPGPHEIRYVTGTSHTVLGRAPIVVVAAGAAIDGPDEIVLGSKFSVTWTGPNNKGDYITIVPADALDAHYGSYVDADKPPPQMLTAPTEAGAAELRYVTGQGKKVLARRAIQVRMAEVTLAAPDSAIAGTTIDVTWSGPNNAGDYITIVADSVSDGQYGNYTNTTTGSPLKLLVPIMSGDAELRYMTGQGNKVLARRPIKVVAAHITLAAVESAAAGSEISITWTGPNNPGDYITVVPMSTPDGQYGDYSVTANGSPLKVKAPKNPGGAEVRYMTGQGGKVLARIPIKIVP